MGTEGEGKEEERGWRVGGVEGGVREGRGGEERVGLPIRPASDMSV